MTIDQKKIRCYDIIVLLAKLAQELKFLELEIVNDEKKSVPFTGEIKLD